MQKSCYVGPKVCAKKGYPSTTHYAKSPTFVQKVDLIKTYFELSVESKLP